MTAKLHFKIYQLMLNLYQDTRAINVQVYGLLTNNLKSTLFLVEETKNYVEEIKKEAHTIY
jgi:hypothetical protein